jgi:putative ABC transport system ATP-binding protein
MFVFLGFCLSVKGMLKEDPYILLEKTGISRLAASYPKELSGGEMRRVAIARSLINKPRLLIADKRH